MRKKKRETQVALYKEHEKKRERLDFLDSIEEALRPIKGIIDLVAETAKPSTPLAGVLEILSPAMDNVDNVLREYRRGV